MTQRCATPSDSSVSVFFTLITSDSYDSINICSVCEEFLQIKKYNSDSYRTSDIKHRPILLYTCLFVDLDHLKL